MKDAFRPPALGPWMTLQNLSFPEKHLCLEPHMFVHAHGNVAYDRELGAYRIAPDAVVKFDT